MRLWHKYDVADIALEFGTDIKNGKNNVKRDRKRRDWDEDGGHGKHSGKTFGKKKDGAYGKKSGKGFAKKKKK